MEVVLGMPFLTFSNADIQFAEKELTWRTYTTADALPTTQRVELIDKKEFAKTAFDEESKTFVVHVAALEASLAGITIHPSRKAQIAALIQVETPTKVSTEYADYADVFSFDLAMELLENTGINKHAIELQNGEQPPYRPIYSLVPVELETLKTYIETHLKTGFIWPSKFPAGAPILFDKKPDGSLRLCLNYRGLNNLTIKNWYPLPLISETLDRLGRAKRFTQLDLTSAYYRMRIREVDKWKTAFRTRYGHFEYQVMPFGLSNAPASFQGYINNILAEKLNVFVIVYLDNILIYTNDEGQGHIEAVWCVLDLLQKNGLFANLKKGRFHQDEVRFLGYVVLAQGVRMEDERIEAVRNRPEPKLMRDIQVFLSFANFYRHFIQGFSKIAGPLTSMLRTTWSAENLSLLMAKDAEFGRVGSGGDCEDETVERSPRSKNSTGATGYLTPEARLAFTQLRQAFNKAPILRHFDSECHIRIETNASGYAIGGVLSQLTLDNLGRWQSRAFYLQKMIPAKTWYKTHDDKLLAIIEAFKTWRHYLKGCKHKVVILTNHNNLYRFMNMKNLSSRQVCWAQKLFRYHFRIDYCQGKANGAADALSRFPQRNKNEKEKLRAENTQILHCLQSSLTNATLSGLSVSASSNLSPLHQVLICGTHGLPQLRQFWDTFRSELANEGPYKVSIGSMRLRLQELQETDSKTQELRTKDGYQDIDGVLHYQGLLFVPEVIRTELISRHHDDPLAGHFGIDKTQELVAQKYFWPTLRHDVEAYVKSCDVCLALKAVRHKPYGDLQSLPVPTHQWKDLTMDFVTGLPISTNWKGDSYDSILVIVDQLTKIVHYELVKITMDAPVLAKVIIDVVVRHHGFPDSIVTNRGSMFTSKFCSSLCYFLGIKRRLSTVFYPQTDGQTKQQNSIMEAYLRVFDNLEQND